jgi:bacteriocin-like protein
MEKFKELSIAEMQEVDGGNNKWKKGWDLFKKGMEYLGIMDAVLEFKEGFQDGYNSNVEECC